MSVRVGGLEWTLEERTKSGGGESWRLTSPDTETLGTYLWLGDYGPPSRPDDPFSGVVLGSGGPFRSAGVYDSIEEAMVGVVPFVRGYIKDRLDHLQGKIDRLLAASQEILDGDE